MKVSIGDRVRLHTPQGRKRVVTVNGADVIEWDDSEEAGHLPADTVGTVIAIVPGDVTGVGDNTKEHAAILFGPAEPHGAPGQRIWSYPTDSFENVFESAPAKTEHRMGAFVKEVG